VSTGLVAIAERKVETLGALRDRYDVLDALAIDNAWALVHRTRKLSAPVVLDFSATKYLSHDSLIYLGALLRFRSKKKYETKIVLPREPRVIEYLRSWRFPAFIRSVTGMPFEASLDPRSVPTFKQHIGRLPRFVQVIRTPTGGTEELLPRRHFSITPIRLNANPFRAATLVQDSWLERHLVSVLDRYLDGQGRRIATHILLEATLNAASHPNASIAYTSSQFLRYAWRGEDNELEIAIWDDGDPVGLTIQRALKATGNIQSPAFGAVQERFDVRLQDPRGKETRHALSSDDHVLPADYQLLTVAAFMLGVTSIPERSQSTDQGGPATSSPVRLRDQGGLGLYLIRRTTIDLFGGRLRYYSGNYRMAMSGKASDRSHYDVLLQYRPRTAWPISGNLLLINIPLRDVHV
jgi:hypothetical protein